LPRPTRAQSYLHADDLVVIIPAVAAMLPGVELTPKLSLIPILNVSLSSKSSSPAPLPLNFIAIIFLSTCVYAAAALFIGHQNVPARIRPLPLLIFFLFLAGAAAQQPLRSASISVLPVAVYVASM